MDFTALGLEKSLINVCFTTNIELNKVMEDSYQKLRLKYQSLDTDSLIELNRSGGQSETAHSALREELSCRGKWGTLLTELT
jgi:hypothetical protein